MDETYKCEACGGVFKKGWSDEEAMAESEAIWGASPSEALAIVCDDCFKRMLPHA